MTDEHDIPEGMPGFQKYNDMQETHGTQRDACRGPTGIRTCLRRTHGRTSRGAVFRPCYDHGNQSPGSHAPLWNPDRTACRTPGGLPPLRK